MPYNTPGISKPPINKTKKKPLINNIKSSDRRLAAGRQPAQFLASQQKTTSLNAATISRTSQILQTFKNKQFQQGGGGVVPSGSGSNGSESNNSEKCRLTVKRQSGNKTWEDRSLLEWDPTHFRIFVGNLGPDVTDEILFRSFIQYPSLSKVRVMIDNKTQKPKGFGFVAFSDADDYLNALNDMNGKYIGQRTVQLKRAKTEIKPIIKRK